MHEHTGAKAGVTGAIPVVGTEGALNAKGAGLVVVALALEPNEKAGAVSLTTEVDGLGAVKEKVGLLVGVEGAAGLPSPIPGRVLAGAGDTGAAGAFLGMAKKSGA